MKLKKLAYCVSMALTATPLYAQTAPPAPQKVERVEVTGSNVKRAADEAALPVQIITRA